MTPSVAVAAVAPFAMLLLIHPALRWGRTPTRTFCVDVPHEPAAALVTAALAAVGRRVRTVVSRSRDGSRDHHFGIAAVGAPLGLVVAPAPTVVVAVVIIAMAVLGHRRDRRRRTESILRELPEIVDLYLVAMNSGHSVATATTEVAHRGKGIVASELVAVVERSRRGQSLEVALDTLHHQLGPQARSVTAVLVSGLRYGTPVVDPLGRVSADLRLERRRHAEQAARRLPVVMLFPLVLCVLPAFGLLTVVPVLVESLHSLRL